MSFLVSKTKALSGLGASALLVISVFLPSAAAEETVAHNFTDVSPRYEKAVSYVVGDKISNGISATQFGINKEIIRGDAAIMIARAAGYIDETNEAAPSGFLDIPARGMSAINALKEAGIVNGKSETTFDFYSNITRGEAAIMLAKAYELNSWTSKSSFTDVIGTRYESSVSALVDNGVTFGTTPTQYGTFRNIQRGDFAIFLDRIEGDMHLDINAPILQYEGDLEINLKVNEAFNAPIVNAIDNMDESVEVALTITDASGSEVLLEDFTTAFSGAYLFTYTATDIAGNNAEELTIAVTVSENEVIPEPVDEFTFLELNKPYISTDNKMTVTMEKLEVVDIGDFYEVNFTYREKNNTTNQAIDQGAFKIYYENGESQPQYGFFDKLYPGEEAVKTYTFKALNSQEVKAIEYGADLFFKEEPTIETLKWIVESPLK